MDEFCPMCGNWVESRDYDVNTGQCKRHVEGAYLCETCERWHYDRSKGHGRTECGTCRSRRIGDRDVEPGIRYFPQHNSFRRWRAAVDEHIIGWYSSKGRAQMARRDYLERTPRNPNRNTAPTPIMVRAVGTPGDDNGSRPAA